MTIFLLGCVSFVISTFLVHYSDNTITRLIYIASGLWLAIGWHVIMAFTLVWLIIGMNMRMHYALNFKKIAVILLSCALIWSGYGLWCAFHPKVVHVTVKIKDLPDSWKDKTAVQLSDIHLGNIYGAKFIENVISKVNAEHPDIVFITGDLFDGMDGAREHLLTPIKNLHTTDGIFFITGNHEMYVGVDAVYKTIENTSIHVLNDEMRSVDDMQIVGIAYPERGAVKNIRETLQNIQDFDPQKPNILLYHTPAGASEAQQAGIDLQLAGHTHRGQLFPFQLITRYIYGPYFYGQTKEDDFTMYTSGGVGTWGPPMRTSGRPEIVIIHFE